VKNIQADTSGVGLAARPRGCSAQMVIAAEIAKFTE
jgi:hypothetical protein